MSLASLDVNVLLRLALKDLPEHHERAKRLVCSLPNSFIIGHAALSEFVYALQHHYRLGRSQIASMMRWVLALPTIVGDYGIIHATIDLYETHPSLSYTDCYLAEEAVIRGAEPLWTFDKKLSRQHQCAQQVPEN